MIQSDKSSFLSFNLLRLITAVISLLLSLFAYYMDDIINSDAVMYLAMSQAYLDGGLNAAAEIFDWPFFAILIAWLGKTFSLQLELTAVGVNSLLFVLFTDALLLISKRILPNSQQVLIAAVLILAFYSINEYREFIIRDIGYWAFLTLALYQFMTYLERPSYQSAILWQVFALIAFLFRIEAAVLIAFMPVFVFFVSPLKTATKQIFQLNTLIIPVALTSILLMLSMSGLTEAFAKLSEYLIYLNAGENELKIDNRLQIFEEQVLNRFSEDYSVLILFSGLFTLILFKLVKGVSLSYWLLLIIAFKLRKQTMALPHRGVLIWFITVNFLILTVFVFNKYFLVGRYSMMALVGIFLLLLPSLTNTIESLYQQKRYKVLFLSALIILAGLIDVYHSTNSKTYIKTAAIWAAKNLPSDSKLLTDDEFINYYLKRENPESLVTYKKRNLRNYRKFDYLVVDEKNASIPKKVIELLKEIHTEQNKRGNRAVVYEVLKSDS